MLYSATEDDVKLVRAASGALATLSFDSVICHKIITVCSVMYNYNDVMLVNKVLCFCSLSDIYRAVTQFSWALQVNCPAFNISHRLVIHFYCTSLKYCGTGTAYAYIQYDCHFASFNKEAE